MAAVSEAFAAMARRALTFVEKNKEVVAIAVGYITYQQLSQDEARRKTMKVRILAPPFTFGSDDPVSAGFMGLVAAWSTLSIISKQAMPLLALTP